jgi:hypothetical protein
MARPTPKRCIREGTILLRDAVRFGGPSTEGLDGSLEGYTDEEILYILSIVFGKLARAAEALGRYCLANPSAKEPRGLLQKINKLGRHYNAR